MLEACTEEDEDDNYQSGQRKSSRESSTIEFGAEGAAGGARPSLGGVSAISSGDTSVLINTDEMNDSTDWSPEIPFENVELN